MANHEDVEWRHREVWLDGYAEVAKEEGARFPGVAQNERNRPVVAPELARLRWRVDELEQGVAYLETLSAPGLVGGDPTGRGERPQLLVKSVAWLGRPSDEQADRERLEYGDEALCVIGVGVGVDDCAEMSDAERPQCRYYDSCADVVVGEGRPATVDQHGGAGTYAQEDGVSLAHVEEPDVWLRVPCWQRVGRAPDDEA